MASTTITPDEDSNKYIPGVCNIGPDEWKKRRSGVYAGLVFVLLVALPIYFLKLNPLWRLVVFLPLVAFTVSYQQWQQKFCVGFGMKGVFNFGELGKTYDVMQQEFLKKDRQKAMKMIIIGIVSAALITVAFYFIP